MKITYYVFLLSIFSLHSMEQEIVKKSSEDKSSIPLLQTLAAKACEQNNQPIPKLKFLPEVKKSFKLYSPITTDSAAEQYALALELKDKQRKKKCQNQLTKKYIPKKRFSFYYDSEPVLKNPVALSNELRKFVDPCEKKHENLYRQLELEIHHNECRAMSNCTLMMFGAAQIIPGIIGLVCFSLLYYWQL